MKLLLFDIDGTLIRSDGVGRTAMARAIEEVAGLPNPLARVSLGGKTDPLILQEAFAHAGHVLDGEATPIYARYLELLEVGLAEARGYRVLPGVTALLEHLAALPELALALGTGNIEPGARLKLGRGGLNRYFATGGFGSDASDRVDVLRAGVAKARRLWGPDFESVWVIGDTPRDIEAARQAGLRVLAVATGGYAPGALAEHAPDALVENFEALDEAARALLNA